MVKERDVALPLELEHSVRRRRGLVQKNISNCFVEPM